MKQDQLMKLIELKMLAERQTLIKGDPGKKGNPGYTPEKGKDYLTQEEVQQFKLDVVETITPQIEKFIMDTVPSHEKSIEAIIERVLEEVDDGDDGEDAEVDYELIYATVIERLKQEIPTIEMLLESVSHVTTPESLRDKLESLEGDERLDKSAIKGLETVIDQETMDRAISILDQRTQFLINKTGGSGTSGGAGTLAEVSAGSLTTPDSLYQMTSTIPVNFKSSDGNTLLYLDETNGRVGIGTTSPRGLLDVYGINSVAYFGSTAGQIGAIGNTRRLNYGDILFGRNLQGVSGADTYATSTSSAAAGYGGIEFRYTGETRFYGASGATTAGGVVTPTAKMIISNSGNVGIGTISPSTTLHVYGGAGGGSTPTAGTDLLTIENSSTAYINIVTPTNASGGIYFSDNARGRGSVTYNHNTDVLQFGRGGTGNEIVLSATGLGIGQTTPAYKLDVLGSGTAAASIGMKVVGGTSAAAGGLKLGAYNATYGGFWSAAVTPSTSNYALIADSAVTALNATSNVYLYNNNNARVLVNSTGMLVSNSLTGTPDRAFHAEVSDSVTNAVTYAQRLSHITSGTATTSFGTGIEYELENASGTNRVAGTEEFTWSDATDATEDTTYTLKLMRAGTLTTELTVTSGGVATFVNTVKAANFDATTGVFYWTGKSHIAAPSDGVITIWNNANTDFSRLQFGGTTSSFPSIKRNGTGLIIRLADDSGNATLTSGTITSTGGIVSAYGLEAGSAGNIYWNARSILAAPSDGVIRLTNNSATDFSRLQFGGTTSSFPALKRSTVNLQARLADDSAYTDIEVADESYGSGWNGSLEVPTKNAVYDKIETLGGAGSMTLLGSGSGSLTVTAASSNIDTVAISGLTALDSIYIVYTFDATGSDDDGRWLFYQATTNDIIIRADNNSNLGGSYITGSATIRQNPQTNTTYNSIDTFYSGNLGSGETYGNTQGALTAWTGSWDLALRHTPAGTGSGTAYWTWAVYKVTGQ